MVTSNDPVGQQMNNRPSDVPSPSDGGPSPLITFIISAIIVVLLAILIILFLEKKSDDCVGDWSECSTTCTKAYTISVEQSWSGSECEAQAGDIQTCSPGEGACVDPPPGGSAPAGAAGAGGSGDCDAEIGSCMSDATCAAITQLPHRSARLSLCQANDLCNAARSCQQGSNAGGEDAEREADPGDGDALAPRDDEGGQGQGGGGEGIQQPESENEYGIGTFMDSVQRPFVPYDPVIGEEGHEPFEWILGEPGVHNCHSICKNGPSGNPGDMHKPPNKACNDGNWGINNKKYLRKALIQAGEDPDIICHAEVENEECAPPANVMGKDGHHDYMVLNTIKGKIKYMCETEWNALCPSPKNEQECWEQINTIPNNILSGGYSPEAMDVFKCARKAITKNVPVNKWKPIDEFEWMTWINRIDKEGPW
tara:strand:- start:2209 stop:3480 length:1272 start_codon:yes stop_codon:yes gene_type:complete